MKKENKGLIDVVRDGITAARDSLQEITEGIAGTVSTSLSNALKETRQTHAAIAEVVRGAMDSVVAAGDDIGGAADATVVGVFRGVKKTGANVMDSVSIAAAEIVKVTAELRGDVAKAARGAVEGAIAAAKEAGLNIQEVASAVATSAHNAATELGAATAKKVHAAVTGVIAGVEVALKPPKKSAGTAGHHAR